VQAGRVTVDQRLQKRLVVFPELKDLVALQWLRVDIDAGAAGANLIACKQGLMQQVEDDMDTGLCWS
jgi:hypothetical protein